MILVCLVALLLTVSGNPVDECSWGPSYWCQTSEIASRCDKTQYCSQQVWKNNNDKPVITSDDSMVNDEECDLCKVVANYVIDYVERNETEQEVEAELKMVCNYMGGYATECRNFVAMFVDEIWSLAKNDLTADVICQELKLCSANKFLATSLVAMTSTTCKTCDFVAKLVVIATQSKTNKDDVEKMLLKACEIPKPVKTECVNFVKKEFGRLWDKVTDKTQSSKAVCADLFDSCPKPSQQKRSVDISFPGECLLCKEVEGHFLKEEKVEEKLTGICEKVVIAADVHQCVAIVTDIFRLIWSDFNMTDSKKVCEMIGLCSKSSNLLMSAMVLSAPPKVQAVQPKQLQGNDYCALCKVVTSYLENFLNENSTEQEVKGAVDELCSMLGNSSSECTALVNTYFDMIWNLLDSEVKNICEEIGLCNSSYTKVLPKQQKLILKSQAEPECQLCKIATNFLVPYINNSTEAEAEAALMKLCTTLPSTYSRECGGFVNESFPIIWNLLKQEMSSGDICTRLGLCSSNNKLQKTTPIKKEQGIQAGPECDLCKLAANYLKTFVDSNSSEAEVETKLRQLCALLPSSVSGECGQFVNTSFPMMWLLVKEEVDSGDICSTLGLCSSNNKLQKTTLIKKEQGIQAGPECDLCKLAANYLKTFVDSNSSEAEVETKLRQLCALLPSSVSGECGQFVNTSFPMMWLLVKEEVDSGDICSTLGLCSSNNKLQQTILIKKEQGIQAGPECDLCKLAANYIKPFVDSNSSEAEAEAALRQVCALLPSSVSGECGQFVNTSFPVVWLLVKQEVDSGDICSVLGLCSSNNKLQQTTPIKKEQGKIECMICGFLLKEIIAHINSSNFENLTVNALEKICDVIPSSMKDECIDLVQTYGDEIIKAIINNPTTVCTAIGLCILQTTTTHVEGVVCGECEELLTDVKTLMTNHPSWMKPVLDSLCKEMPAAISGECTDLVNEYEQTVVELIAENINPQALCKDVKLCAVAKKANYDSSITKSTQYKRIPRSHYSAIECDGCLQMFEEMEVLLPKKKDAIISAVSDMCNKFLPKEANDVCQIVCVELGDKFVDMIAYDINPRADCKALGVCQTMKKSPSLANPFNSLNLL